MNIVAIDPGLDGAIVFLPPCGEPTFYDMPTALVGSNGKAKRTYDAYDIAARLASFGKPLTVYVEKQQAMPPRVKGRKQGVSSSFATGYGFGLLLGIVAGLQIPVELVHPRTWKAAMMRDCAKEKSASVLKAKQLFPQCAGELTRKKDHNRADALLLAAYGRRLSGGGG